LFFIKKKKKGYLAGCQWLTPVILATWQAEIRRIVVPGQPRQTFVRHNLSEKNLGVVVHACHPSDGGKHKIGELLSSALWVKSETISKITRSKRAGGLAQAIKQT
jgi:hypothetical protein